MAGSPRSGQPGPQLPERSAEQTHAPARGRPEGLRGDLPRATAGQLPPGPLPLGPSPRTPSLARPSGSTSPRAPSLQAGANINAVDKQQRTPLMEAVVNNHLEAARYMVQRGGCVYSKVCRASPTPPTPTPPPNSWGLGSGGGPRNRQGTHWPASPSGGGRLHLPAPCSQNWELGDGQPAAQHGTGGCQRPGQWPGCPTSQPPSSGSWAQLQASGPGPPLSLR